VTGRVMGRGLDVGVVGCGTAGAAAALFLARAGHRVTVYERVPDPGPVGAGIILQPTGQAVRARLGLADEVLARGARLSGLTCRTHRGRTILDLSYDLLDPALFGLGMHRGVLFEQLFGAARAECTVRCGVGIDGLRRSRAGVHLVDEGGASHGPHELVVVADGARSRLRDDVPLPCTARPYPWGALWFLAQDPARSFRDRLFQVVRSSARMLGLLPTGLGPGEGVHPVTSVYWSIRSDAVDAFRRRGLVAWKDEVRALLSTQEPSRAEAAEPLLAQLEHVEQLVFTQYHDVEMFPWHHDRVVFLGDAAHATSPQLGQGCNLALLDALTLAECMRVFSEVPRALDAYSRRRRAHLGVYQQATRWLTPFFQGEVEVLGDLRDLLMGPVAQVPFFRTMMMRSMAGILGDWFGGALPLPAADPRT
jgi:2-polyprenyl-6-methoxyphenol hydroxylase-like FAD-dependent oxidoreductase